MRGWLHFWSFAVSIAACADVDRGVGGPSRGGRGGRDGRLQRHGARPFRDQRALPPPGLGPAAYRAVMRHLDHSMIFLFIAGTYTPFAVLAMDRPTAELGARRGVGRRAGRRRAEAALAGRAPVGRCADLHRAGLGRGVRAARSPAQRRGRRARPAARRRRCSTPSAASCTPLHWPNPWPHTFGYHEFFHAATVLAAICHHVAVWLALF